MHYLTPAETLQNGWPLYWCRTMNQWFERKDLPPDIMVIEWASARYFKLLTEYRVNCATPVTFVESIYGS